MRAEKAGCEWRLYLLGSALCAALIVCSLYFSDRGGPGFFASFVVAGLLYLLSLRELFAAPRLARRVAIAGLFLAALWHVAFLRVTPGSDDDIHRYVWDGRIQRLGYNPYLVIPSDASVATLHTAETRTLNHPDLPSPYPPGAELFFRSVAAIHESVFALKLAFVLCEIGIALLLLELLRSTGQGEHWVLAYAWNPLLAVEVAGSGHIDIYGVLLLMVSALALLKGWRAVAAVALGLAVAVKFLPIVLLPLYWKRIRIHDAALAVATVALLYVPFLDHGRLPLGSLGTYVQSFRFNDPVFAIVERMTTPQVAGALALMMGFLTAFWIRKRSVAFSLEAVAWPMAASLLCAPVVYPWYLLWLLPYMRSAAALPIAIWTVSIGGTYYVWHLRGLGRPWIIPGWIMLVEYGSVAASAAIVFLLRNRRPLGLESSAAQ